VLAQVGARHAAALPPRAAELSPTPLCCICCICCTLKCQKRPIIWQNRPNTRTKETYYTLAYLHLLHLLHLLLPP